ncbi:MAG TPA: hypothetical protein DGT23_29740 [Micromonosporaceae bacterium]|nr:hypothetical protein [Micromonosporaceae bacterium]
MRIELTGRHPFLRRTTPVHHEADDAGLVLDARGLGFASPLELTAIPALAHTAQELGASTAILVPANDDVTSYMQRMNVFRLLPADTSVVGHLPDQQRRDRSAVLIEVFGLTPNTEGELAERIGDLAVAHLGPSEGRLFFQSAGELIDNAISHGCSDIGAFAAAQTYTGKTSRRRGLEFAVCDTGIGVHRHLKRNPRHGEIPNAESALDLATRKGVTGTPDRRGNGLYDLFNVANAGGYSRLVMRSGKGLANIVARDDDRRRAFTAVADPIRGTWAWLRVRHR